MNITHPNGRSKIFMQSDLQFVADVELDHPGWIAFGYVSGAQNLLVDREEWPAFVAMVAEIDAELKQV